MNRRLPWAAWLLPCLLLLSVQGAFAQGIALLVPAYFEPDTVRWPALGAAAARVPLVAIANVFNGPGADASPLPSYTAAIGLVRRAGGQVVGYVYTRYGNRPLEEVKKDMARWSSLYDLDGFFVDEMSNQASVTLLNYYADLLGYVRQLGPAYKVIGNPGTNTDELYLKRPAADAIVLFENNAGYATFAPSAWTTSYPSHQFAHLIYAASTPAQMTNYVNLALSRRTGFVYVTDDGGSNPWDTLPSYWLTEVDLIEGINRAAVQNVRATLALVPDAGPTFTLTGVGAVGRQVLEAAPALGDWRALGTNLTNTGTSVWHLLNVPPNRFFRLRQE